MSTSTTFPEIVSIIQSLPDSNAPGRLARFGEEFGFELLPLGSLPCREELRPGGTCDHRTQIPSMLGSACHLRNHVGGVQSHAFGIKFNERGENGHVIKAVISQPYHLSFAGAARLHNALEATGMTGEVLPWSTHLPGSSIAFIIYDNLQHVPVSMADWQR